MDKTLRQRSDDLEPIRGKSGEVAENLENGWLKTRGVKFRMWLNDTDLAIAHALWDELMFAPSLLESSHLHLAEAPQRIQDAIFYEIACVVNQNKNLTPKENPFILV